MNAKKLESHAMCMLLGALPRMLNLSHCQLLRAKVAFMHMEADSLSSTTFWHLFFDGWH